MAALCRSSLLSPSPRASLGLHVPSSTFHDVPNSNRGLKHLFLLVNPLFRMVLQKWLGRLLVELSTPLVMYMQKYFKKKTLLFKNFKLKKSEMLLITSRPNPGVIACFCL